MTEPIKRIEVGASTLQHSIEVLGAIGQQPTGGIVRPVYSPAWFLAFAIIYSLYVQLLQPVQGLAYSFGQTEQFCSLSQSNKCMVNCV